MSRDFFISYHRPDLDAVAVVREGLTARGIDSFLDRKHLVAGTPWPQALEEALSTASAVAVFLGPSELGTWQKREIGFALDRQAQEEKAGRIFPVIPVLLPGSDPRPGFLFLNTWVDLREGLSDVDALVALDRAIRGEEAGEPTEAVLNVSPYRGLEPFREEHAAFFCGRESFSERLVQAAMQRNLVALVGPSGSGKSSVAQAGLLPALRRQRPPSPTWDVVVFTPGERPFDRLARALMPLLEPDLSETDRLVESTKLGRALAEGDVPLEAIVERSLEKSQGSDRLLILADQFEELFTTVPGPDREPFIHALLHTIERTPATLALTLRADFFGNALSTSRELSDRLEDSLVTLGPMQSDELERAIVEPAKRVGLRFEAGLVNRILDDVGSEPGHLPMLEFALNELWARRTGAEVTHASYDAIDGVAGALAQRAEALYHGFGTDEQKIARRVFTRLTRVARPEEGGEDTRRRISLHELDPEAVGVVKGLVQARLLVTGTSFEIPQDADGAGADGDGTAARVLDDTVEVAHEALINGWGRLRGWLYEDREFLLWQERLRIHLAEWERTERDPGGLLRGVPLAEAERWRRQRSEDLSAQEKEFVEAAIAARDRDAERRLRERRTKRLRTASLGVAGVLLVALAVLIIRARVDVVLTFPAPVAERAADRIIEEILETPVKRQ